MTTHRISVVSAGLRVPSTSRMLADDLAAAAVRELQHRGNDVAEVTVVELRELAHELADALLTGFPGGQLADAVQSVTTADALIVVTPTMSAGVSGLFKMFFDVLEPGAIADKPVLLAATGGSERHSLVLDFAMRPLFSYLRTRPLSTGVYAATSDFGGANSAALQSRIERAGRELAQELGEQASSAAPVEPALTPFAELLGR